MQKDRRDQRVLQRGLRRDAWLAEPLNDQSGLDVDLNPSAQGPVKPRDAKWLNLIA
jgi:hypothetical protein